MISPDRTQRLTARPSMRIAVSIVLLVMLPVVWAQYPLQYPSVRWPSRAVRISAPCMYRWAMGGREKRPAPFR